MIRLKLAAALLAAAAAAPRPADVIAMEREVRAMQADVALIKEAAARRQLLTVGQVATYTINVPCPPGVACGPTGQRHGEELRHLSGYFLDRLRGPRAAEARDHGR